MKTIPFISRPKLACLITGVPRGNSLCFESLKLLTAGYDTTFFAVYRDEFDNNEAKEKLKKDLPNVNFIVIPSARTAEALTPFSSDDKFSPTMIKMWHEVFYATKLIDLSNYDMVIRTRFDIFYSPMLLPPPINDDFSIYIPREMSWSGSNDMLALGTPNAFKKYSEIYTLLDWMANKDIRIPEMIVSCALPLLKLKEIHLDLCFGIYRDALMNSFSQNELSVLAWKSPGSTGYKIGGQTDTQENREKWIKCFKDLTTTEALFPTYQVTKDGNFYPTEIDARDGKPFRFMGLHAHLNRALLTVKTIEFMICYRSPNWKLDELKVAIDGHLFKLAENGIDEFGRVLIYGQLETPYEGKRPWSKISFACRNPIIPSKVDNRSTDSRSLTIAITNPIFK